jgi:hypothetical protein
MNHTLLYKDGRCKMILSKCHHYATCLAQRRTKVCKLLFICNYYMSIVGRPPSQKADAKYTILPLTDNARQGLQTLATTTPDPYEYCMNHLSTTPYLPMKGTVFAMKYIDAFEYRLPNYNRIYYVIIAHLRLVVIYHAGEHPDKPSPLTSHQLLLLRELINKTETLRAEETHDDHQTSEPAHGKRKRRT